MAERETMNVSLSFSQKGFVKAQVASGRYRNDSEVVREGLRLLEERERRRRLEELLLSDLERGGPVELTDAYLDELRRRLESLEAGAPGIPAEQVLADIRSTLGLDPS